MISLENLKNFIQKAGTTTIESTKKGSKKRSKRSPKRNLVPNLDEGEYYIDEPENNNLGGFIPLGYNTIGQDKYDFRLIKEPYNFKLLGYLNIINIIQRNLETTYIKAYNHNAGVYSFFKKKDDYYELENDYSIDNDYLELVLTDEQQYIKIYKNDHPTNNYIIQSQYMDFNFWTNNNTIRPQLTVLPINNRQSILIRKDSNTKISRFLRVENDRGRQLISDMSNNIQDYPYDFSISIPNPNGGNNYDLEIEEAEFYSILYNCTPPPKFKKEEIDLAESIIEKEDSQGKYISYPQDKCMIAIDPSVTSRDKDDAINFTITIDESGNGTLIMETSIADIYPYFSEETYPLKYAAFKKETEYLGPIRFNMVDNELSENKLSLGASQNKDRAILTTIEYQMNNYSLDPIPNSVKIEKVKDVQIFATTYTKFHSTIIDPDSINDPFVTTIKDEGVPGFLLPRSNRNNFKLKEDLELNGVFKEGQDTSEYDDYIKERIKDFHQSYTLLSNNLEIFNRQCNFNVSYDCAFSGPKLYHDVSESEHWIHNLIEITALETNTYIAMCQYLDTKYLSKQNIKNLIDTNFEDFFSLDPNRQFKGYYRGQDVDTAIINSGYNYNNSDLSEIYFTDNKYYYQSYFNIDTMKNSKPPLRQPYRTIRALYYTQPISHKFSNITIYTHFTSPLRRFNDLCVHNYLFGNDKSQLYEIFTNSYDINTRFFNSDFRNYLNTIKKEKFLVDNIHLFDGIYIYGITLTDLYGNKIIYIPFLDINVPNPKQIQDRKLIRFNIQTVGEKLKVTNIVGDNPGMQIHLSNIRDYPRTIFRIINQLDLTNYDVNYYMEYFDIIFHGQLIKYDNLQYYQNNITLKYNDTELEFKVTPYYAYYYDDDYEYKLKNYYDCIYYDSKNLSNIATSEGLSLFIFDNEILTRVNILNNTLVKSDEITDDVKFKLVLENKDFILKGDNGMNYPILAIYGLTSGILLNISNTENNLFNLLNSQNNDLHDVYPIKLFNNIQFIIKENEIYDITNNRTFITSNFDNILLPIVQDDQSLLYSNGIKLHLNGTIELPNESILTLGLDRNTFTINEDPTTYGIPTNIYGLSFTKSVNGIIIGDNDPNNYAITISDHDFQQQEQQRLFIQQQEQQQQIIQHIQQLMNYIEDENGNYRYSNGAIMYPDYSVQLPNGTIISSDRNNVTAINGQPENGFFQIINGTQYMSYNFSKIKINVNDKHILFENGLVINGNGTTNYIQPMGGYQRKYMKYKKKYYQLKNKIENTL